MVETSSLVDMKTLKKLITISTQLPLAKVGNELTDSLFALDTKRGYLSILESQAILNTLKIGSANTGNNVASLNQETDSEEAGSFEDKLKTIKSELTGIEALGDAMLTLVDIFYSLALKLDIAKKFFGGDYDATQLGVIDLNLKDMFNINQLDSSNLSLESLVGGIVKEVSSGLTAGTPNQLGNDDGFASNIFDTLVGTLKESKGGQKQGNNKSGGLDEKIQALRSKVEITQKQIEAIVSGETNTLSTIAGTSSINSNIFSAIPANKGVQQASTIENNTSQPQMNEINNENNIEINKNNFDNKSQSSSQPEQKNHLESPKTQKQLKTLQCQLLIYQVEIQVLQVVKNILDTIFQSIQGATKK